MDNFDKQVSDLLARAMQQPGVAEIIQLYENQRVAIEAHQRASDAVAPRWVVYSSSSSAKHS